MTEWLFDLPVDVELVVTTDRSVWFLRTEHYRRSARNGRVLAEELMKQLAIGDRLADDVWQPHLGALLVHTDYVFLRILPVIGAGGRGIMSGEIHAVEPRRIPDVPPAVRAVG